MEGSNSEAVFDSLNVNPQLFVNEVINSIDDIVDGGFEFYEREAARLLSMNDENKLAELSKGVSAIKRLIQASLHKRLDIWEKYCLTHCFSVPEGFSLPQNDSSEDTELLHDALHDSELDAKIDSLREKLVLAGKESDEIHRERCALEKQSTLSRSSVDAITEAVQILEDGSVDVMFQELLRNATELRMKIENLMSERLEAIECGTVEKAYCSTEIQPSKLSKGILTNSHDLLEFVNVGKGP